MQDGDDFQNSTPGMREKEVLEGTIGFPFFCIYLKKNQKTKNTAAGYVPCKDLIKRDTGDYCFISYIFFSALLDALLFF